MIEVVKLLKKIEQAKSGGVIYLPKGVLELLAKLERKLRKND